MNKLGKGVYEIFINTQEDYDKEYLKKYMNLEDSPEIIRGKMGNYLGFLSKQTDNIGTIYVVKDAVSYEERENDYSITFIIELCITFSGDIEEVTQEDMDKRIIQLNKSLEYSKRKTLAQSIPLTDFKYLG